MALKVLVVDDEQELRRHIIALLMSTFSDYVFEFKEAEDGPKALELIESSSYDLIFLDVRLPGMSGLEVLQKSKAQNPEAFVVMLTAHANVQDAVFAIKQGAYDYLSKPLEKDRLVEIVRASLEARSLLSDVSLSNPIFDDDIDSEVVGNSQKMREVATLISKVTQVATTVMIRGETGTGKELVARAIHYNSPRKSQPFVSLSCGAFSEELMAIELFGQERGEGGRKVGQLQIASEGTLFLDDIDQLSLPLQASLLNVLQEGKFRPVASDRQIGTQARIITASHENLERKMEEGSFREDLFYRLSVMPIFLPPLRDRREDIEILALHFLKKFQTTHNKAFTGIHPKAMEILKNYDWPGNIRELSNVIERAFIVETTSLITAQSLPEPLRHPPKSGEGKDKIKAGISYETFKQDAERTFITEALRRNNGKINRTVAAVGIPKNTLLRKIKKYQINVKEFTNP